MCVEAMGRRRGRVTVLVFLCAIFDVDHGAHGLVAVGPKPIDGAFWPDRFPAKSHCSRCGLCESTFVSRVADSCAFLNEGMARMDDAEYRAHGRIRNDLYWTDDDDDSNANANDEGRFGVMEVPMMLGRGVGVPNAQWTGCVTGVAVSMLESGKVDAVVCVASEDGAWSRPEPIVARTAEEVMRGRGVKPSLAPSLRVLDEIVGDPAIERLLFCGVGCAVQAFRAIEDDLNLKEVYVLGTNCADNSPTPRSAENFITKGLKLDGTKVQGYEFMQDFRVHVKVSSDSYVKRPYFCLPGSVAKSSIAESCLACFDYTNGLADMVIGYMAAPLEDDARMDQSLQSITVRNARGATMMRAAVDAGRLRIEREAGGSGAHERFASTTVASDSIVKEMVSDAVPESGAPRIVGEVLATVLGKVVGPKGVNFARYSVDYHVLRNYLHVLDAWGEDRALSSMPTYSKRIVERYLANDDAFAKLQSRLLAKEEAKEASAQP